MKDLLWKALGLAGLLVLTAMDAATAAEVKGKVTGVSGATVTATLIQPGLARIGNEATIALWVEGVGSIPIKGTWRVKSVSENRVVLVPRSAGNAQPLVGQDVTIADTNHIVSAPPRQPARVTGDAVKPVPKPPSRTAAVSRANIRYIQQRLVALGYNAGAADGAMGPKTRNAIRAYQGDHGLSIDGSASVGLRRSLEAAQKKKVSRPGKKSNGIPLSGLQYTDNRLSNVILKEASDYYSGRNGKPQDYERALALNRTIAKRGNREGLFIVGTAYAFGHGVAKDINIARGYFEQALSKGYTRAAYNLAGIYFRGLGVEKDNDKAMAYMRQAATSDDPSTYYGMGTFYRLGVGVESSREAAIHWYLKGARAGNKKCQEQLKKMDIAW